MTTPYEYESEDSAFAADTPRDLRDALDAMTRPEPRLEFRDRLRAAFVSGTLRGPGAEEARVAAVESALAGWNVPVADDDFRARCRETFLTGAVAPTRLGRLRRLVPLAAAAAVLLLLLPQLVARVANDANHEPFVVNGRTVADPSAQDFERLLALPGCSVVDEARESVLLRYGDGLLLEVDPGTEFQVVPSETEGFALDVRLERGVLRVASRPENGGVSVTTPDGRILLRGEAIGIDVLGERGTCICCLEGGARVEPSAPGAVPFEVTAGDAAWLPRGDAPMPMPGDLHHRGDLEELHRAARTHLYY